MSEKRSDEDAPVVYYSTATVVRAAASEEATPDDLMKLILKNAKDPSIFTEDGVRPFTWQAEVSNSGLDSYYTRQDVQSLKNYAKDASAGVMFLDSHDKRQLGLGQSIRGVYTPASAPIDPKKPSDTDLARVTVDFYTVPGLKLGRADSDSFIAGVRSGVINDVSIGFMPESFECNLCGKDPFDWWNMECPHIPGAYYDESGKNIVKKSRDATQAFAWVRNSRLLEVSAVYDGATPGAYVKKAQFLAEAGEIDRAAAGVLERQLRIHLPEQAMNVPVLKIERVGDTDKLVVARGSAIIRGVKYNEGAEVEPMAFRRLSQRGQDDPQDDGTSTDASETAQPSSPPENQNLKREETPEGVAASSGGIISPAHAAPEDLRMSGMNEEQVRALQESARRDADMLVRVRRALATAGVKDAETVDPSEAIVALHTKITDLEPRAQMGDQWRASVIKEALESGVRAEGTGFDQKGWEETFAAMKIEQIRRIGDAWEKQAPKVGGRRTADLGTESPGKAPATGTPVIVDQFAVNGRR
jgi:hypothetical protein